MSKIGSMQILIVEDDILHSEILKNKLKNLGYNNVKNTSTYKDAADYLESYIPDLILIDYYLDKNYTGADLIKEYLLNKDIPIIFISSFYGSEVLKGIVDLGVMDFVPKNATEFDIEKAISLAMVKKTEIINHSKLKDFIFVKHSREIKKVAVDSIEYISVEGKYIQIFAEGKIYLVRSTLNDFLKKLPDNFIKIHQAYIINLKYLETIQVDESIVKVGVHKVPFSRNYKKELFSAYYLP